MPRFFLTAILIIFLLPGCTHATPHAKEFLLMDTFVHIEIMDRLADDTKKIIVDRVRARMEKLARNLNFYSSDGELAVINSLRKDEWLVVSEDMFRILRWARLFRGKTNGLFDVTLGRKSDSWGLNVNKHAVYFRENGVKIDLSGIAKGFAVDEGIRLLVKLGVKNALINAGGDMYCLGAGPKGKGWKVGIRDPKDPRRIVEILEVRDRGVATSGGYERFKEEKGVMVSHIVDPRTGQSVGDIFKSVTVMASDCTTADALATALYVLEPTEAITKMDKIIGADCIVVDENGQKHFSRGFIEQP